MCGITGIFNLNGNAVTHQEMVKVTRAIAHRGPDGEGIFIDDNLGLGPVYKENIARAVTINISSKRNWKLESWVLRLLSVAVIIT